MSAALVIARWCWPELPWEQAISDVQDVRTEVAGEVQALMDCDKCGHADDRFWNAHDAKDVTAAERILIERWHADAYGMALCDDFEWVHADLSMAEVAKIATAPLDARVRAMAAVIEKLEKNT